MAHSLYSNDIQRPSAVVQSDVKVFNILTSSEEGRSDVRTETKSSEPPSTADIAVAHHSDEKYQAGPLFA